MNTNQIMKRQIKNIKLIFLNALQPKPKNIIHQKNNSNEKQSCLKNDHFHQIHHFILTANCFRSHHHQQRIQSFETLVDNSSP